MRRERVEFENITHYPTKIVFINTKIELISRPTCLFNRMTKNLLFMTLVRDKHELKFETKYI